MLNENLARKKRNMKVIQYWADNKTGAWIAEKLNMTRSAVLGVVNRARQKGILQFREQDDKKARKKPAPVTRVPSLPVVTKSPPQPVKIVSSNISELFLPKNPVTVSGPIKFADLHRSMCRYPINDGDPKDFLFCGQPRVSQTPYCAEHGKVCFVSYLKYTSHPENSKSPKYAHRP